MVQRLSYRVIATAHPFGIPAGFTGNEDEVADTNKTHAMYGIEPGVCYRPRERSVVSVKFPALARPQIRTALRRKAAPQNLSSGTLSTLFPSDCHSDHHLTFSHR